MKVSLGKYPRSASRERKMKIQIDPWDTWNMDHTLALIIHPMLIQLKKTKIGSPHTDENDIPESLNLKGDEYLHERWNWILDEIIWSFSQILDKDADTQFYSGTVDMNWEKVEGNELGLHEVAYGPNHTHKFDKEGWEQWHERKRNGLKLFGKYFESLWD